MIGILKELGGGGGGSKLGFPAHVNREPFFHEQPQLDDQRNGMQDKHQLIRQVFTLIYRGEPVKHAWVVH